MTKRMIACGAVAIALVAGGCAELTQYDNDMSSCSASNGRYKIEIYASRDSDQTTNDVVLPAFQKACRDIGAAAGGSRSFNP